MENNMKLTIDIQDRTTFATFSIITIACVVYYILYVPVILDDSYIYFRVADRFASTGVPTFNDGDVSSIATSPLWITILTVAYIITGKMSLVMLSKTLSIILMIGSSGLLYSILSKRFTITAPFAAIAVFFAPSMNIFVGHDTAISLFCGLGIIHAFEFNKKSLPLWIALFYLARGEGAVFGGIVALIAFFSSSLTVKERIQYYYVSALIGISLIVIWHGFYWNVFGDIFPSTLEIKRLQAESGWPTFATYIWQHLNWINKGTVTLITISFILIGIILMTWQITLLIIWPIIHFIVYALIKVPNYGWYYYPIDFILGLAILISATYIFNYIIDYTLNFLNSDVFNSIKKISAIILSIMIIIVTQPIFQSVVIPTIRGKANSHRRYIAYTELSNLMPSITGRADFTLLTHEIGIFGFLQPQAYIRDVVGLATPIHDKKELWNWDGRILQFNPDIILRQLHNPPRYQLFGFKSATSIKAFERVAIASNGAPYALYRPVNETNETIKTQIPALQAMATGATRLSAPIKAVALDNDHFGFFAHAPSNIFLDVPDNTTAIKLGFGYEARAWQGNNNPDGANFIVRSSNDTLLFHRFLNPKRITTDRGTKFTTINLQSNVKRIELVIEPGSNTKWDWTYWTAHTWHNKIALNSNNAMPFENTYNEILSALDRFDIIKGGGTVNSNPLIFLHNKYVHNAHSESLLAYHPHNANFELCFGIRP